MDGHVDANAAVSSEQAACDGSIKPMELSDVVERGCEADLQTISASPDEENVDRQSSGDRGQSPRMVVNTSTPSNGACSSALTFGIF